MAKITKAGGPTNAAEITRSAFGGHVDAGLNERAAGFSDDTAATALAAEQHKEPEVEAPFDPSLYTVADVVRALPDLTEAERGAVLAAERAGLNRAGIVGKA